MAKNNIDKLIVIGDRVLIEPALATHKTKGGLLLPAGYQEKEEIQTGYILKCGPGYPLPSDRATARLKTRRPGAALPAPAGASRRYGHLHAQERRGNQV